MSINLLICKKKRNKKTNTFIFMLTYVQILFKGPSGEIGRLLSNKLSKVKLKPEIS